MSTTLSNRDVGLRNVVTRQLDWDPEVDASQIGVVAKNDIVTLTGFIDTYHGKLAAERAAKRVTGVRAVANDLQVRLRLERTDPEIAIDVTNAIGLRSAVAEKIQAAVHTGHVTLTGAVPWLFQKLEAEKAIRHVRGVRGVKNYITVVPKSNVRDLKRRIVSALHRSAEVDARAISVTTEGTHVMLTGTVKSWAERDAAERAARDAPGITAVENNIDIAPLALDFDFGDFDDIC